MGPSCMRVTLRCMPSPVPMRSGPHPSAIAIALCLVIVAGSVLFGIFGPSVAQRSMLGGGTSIGDLLGNAVALRDQLLWQGLDLGTRNSGRNGAPAVVDGGTPEDTSRTLRAGAATAIARIVGDGTPIPDLSKAGFEFVSWSVASLRGGRDDTVALGFLDRTRESFVALLLTVDDGRFVVFDGFGRAIPLLPDRLYAEDLPRPSRADGVAMVWTTGPVLAIAIIDSTEEAAALRSALGAP